MDPNRFKTITRKYRSLGIAVAGDFCLDRYLEIDPSKQEGSIETGLPVHNVVNVRAQPGGAGTIVNNLAALGIGRIYPIGFSGNDAEGLELRRALKQLPGVHLAHFIRTSQRRTFTYCKPLLLKPGASPIELNRFDLKNWTPTPAVLQGRLINRLQRLAKSVDAVIVLDQVDTPETGVVTQKMLAALGALAKSNPNLFLLADSRRGLRNFPALNFKMNSAELSGLVGRNTEMTLQEIEAAATGLADANGRSVFVTLSERGILAATPKGKSEHLPALPVRGPIDIVGAGDAVMANLATAVAAGATLRESLEIATAAASVVIHKLGTTGTAGTEEIGNLLFLNKKSPAVKAG